MSTSANNFVSRFIDWLENHRAVNLLLILLYFIFIYYMHDSVVHLSIWVMNLMSLSVYNKVVIVISILLLILFGTAINGQIRKHTDNYAVKAGYLFFTIAIIIIHFKTMFEMNIEIIHIFEYPALAVLLFPITRRFGAAIIFTIPFMLMDEWHQYVVLYPGYVDYFEFNDIMVDMYGCGLAMLVLMVFGVEGQQPVKPFWKRTELGFILASLIVFAIAVKLCFISVYEADKCSDTELVLYRIHEPVTFWRKYPNRDVVYHVMQPIEAITGISLLAIIYTGLDSFRK